VLVTHDEAALQHAEAAETAKDNPHTKNASLTSRRLSSTASKVMRTLPRRMLKKLWHISSG
jgi:hypothetical protein